MFFCRQAPEYVLVVELRHGCALGQGKELCGEPLVPKIVEQVSAVGEDVSIVITKGMVVILEKLLFAPGGSLCQCGDSSGS